MRIFTFLGLGATLTSAALLAMTACGEDKGVVRPRLDSGVSSEGGLVGEGGLGCGVAIPTTYTSTNFAANAAVELALAQHVSDLDAAMTSTEGTSTGIATATDLENIYNAGAPSLRSLSTTDSQTLIDNDLIAFGNASGKTWTPAEAATDGGVDGGVDEGGKFENLFYESPIGIDLRQAVDNAVLGGALYEHVLGLVAAPITDVTIDQILASYGASEALADSTDVDAGANGDRLVAALASKRDDGTATGLYRRMKTDLLTMKASVAAGDACKTDLNNAVSDFLLGWEQAIYASAIYSLNSASQTVTGSAADPPKAALSLHAFGAAIGLVQSFKGLPADKRKITDGQIDTILSTMLADTPYKLVTETGAAILGIQQAIQLIALYEGFDAAAVTSYEQ